MPQLWKVVGGEDKGGIIVREAEALASPQVQERLAYGSLVEELELKGSRLHFRRREGSGPQKGWVSISLHGKSLLCKQNATKEPVRTLQEAVVPMKLAPPEPQVQSFVPPSSQLGLDARGGGRWGRLRVPWVPPLRGAHIMADRKLLEWMAMKCHLRQDMFFMADPGAHVRQAVLQFAALEGWEVEYVGITRDTNESDLKQRREITDGHLRFCNAPAVEAALHGRLLILEGIEKAERNVLPLLNNLLENREMALEDGSFLMSPQRKAGSSSAGGRRLLATSADFITVAIGLPVPKYPGSALDPPLRSRFAGKSMPSMPPVQELELLQKVAPSADKDVLNRLVGCVYAWRAAGDPRGAAHWKERRKEEMEVLLKAPRLPRFPELGLLSVARLLALFPRISPSSILHRAFPWSLLRLGDVEQKTLSSALKAFKLEQHLLESSEYDLSSVEQMGQPDQGQVAIAFTYENTISVTSNCPRGHWPLNMDSIRGLTSSQRQHLVQMLQDHSVGMDMCLIGARGVGKTLLVRSFAQLLGYRVHTLFCFKDMTARDLTLRRSTDEQGNTSWHLSSLLEAAINGGIAILDGVHRLPSGALVGILGRLICDRALSLPDGNQLVPRDQWDAWLAAGKTEEHLLASGFRPVHRSFRVIATAEPLADKEKPWLTDEVLTLFHFIEVQALLPSDQLRLVESVCKVKGVNAVRGLIEYMAAVREASLADPTLEPMLISTRQLLHAGRHLAQRPEDVVEAVRRALSAYFSFLPPLTRDSVTRILHTSMMKAGVKIDLRNKEELVEQKRQAELAADRGQRLKDLEEGAISLRWGRNAHVENEIQEELQQLAEEKKRDQSRLKEQVMTKAKNSMRLSKHNATPSKVAVVESDTEVCIDNVRLPKRQPQCPELVPSIHFVDIPQHVTALKCMMVDWLLGRHLLLIGNQGVGKNKLADRFLSLLCIEREYLQLHRDTTVQSLTLQPMLRGGIVVYEDSPLVCAVRHGRVLVIDEADKAPLEVVCILKSLAEDGEFTLGDGRTIIHPSRVPPQLLEESEDQRLLPMAEGFRMIVLANRPGHPFLGNDFYRECGDVFASHAVENPDVASEVELLRSYGPHVPEDTIVKLLGLFNELRHMVDQGILAYPYSTRELVRVVQHLEAFPGDNLEDTFNNVFAFDWHDQKLRETLSDVLHGIGIGMGSGKALPFTHGDPNKMLPKDFKSAKHWDSGENAENDGEGHDPGDVGVKDYDDAEDMSGKRHRPRSGNWDGRQHLGEGPWDGGSGGTGTAGIGGRAGPYRLDVGQELVLLTEDQKKEVPDDWHEAAKKMADEAYASRLKELEMNGHDEEEYGRLHAAVQEQIAAMRIVLQSHEAKERERSWKKQQMHGELDENRIVDGIVGSRNIYRRRGDSDNTGFEQELPKRIKFVLDCSGSMYTFNRIDQRLQRLQETTIFIMESFSGLEHKYQYSIVGHSGTGPEAEMLVPWGKPPRGPKEQFALVKRMAAHAQFAHSGDSTLEASDRAIKDILKQPADEYFVFIVSDADLARYGISPADWDRILMQDRRVNAYVLLISSNTDEAESIRGGLSPGHGFVCDDNDLLATTFKQIFQTTMLKNRV